MEIKTIIPNLNELNVSHANLPGHHARSYYRSKIFSSQIGINPLITAASPLLSIVDKLKKTQEAPELSKLHYDLVHEIKAFENKAQSLGYRSQIIHAARYILCIWIDEIILHAPWAVSQEWEKRTLINNFQHHSNSHYQFFTLLTHCKQDAPLYIDLLEMMYLCLCLGYEGEYRFQEYNSIQLNKIMDDLYECIHMQRGDFSKKLEISITEGKKKLQKRSYWRYLPLSLAILVSITSLIGMYTFLDQQLNKTSDVVYQNLQSLMKNPVSGKTT